MHKSLYALALVPVLHTVPSIADEKHYEPNSQCILDIQVTGYVKKECFDQVVQDLMAHLKEAEDKPCPACHADGDPHGEWQPAMKRLDCWDEIVKRFPNEPEAHQLLQVQACFRNYQIRTFGEVRTQWDAKK